VKLKPGVKIYNATSTVPWIVGVVVPGGAYCHTTGAPNQVLFVPAEAMRFTPPVVTYDAEPNTYRRDPPLG
jgi:hypothetical protein